MLPQWKLDYYNRRAALITAELAALNACLLAFVGNPITSYQLSTGQTMQQVTRAGLPSIRAWRDDLERQLFDILGLLNCDSSVVYVRPGF
jgi:hypothetical protein